MANNTDWLNISQLTGGTGETALSLTALTNTSLSSKTATVTAKNDTYNVSGTTTVTIQGFVPTLTLSRSTLRFDSTGGTATFTVYSNTAWTINFPSLVYSYSASAGTGDTEITVVVAPNPDEVAKVETGTVQDVYNVNQLFLTIVQESFIAEISIEPDDDIVFPATGGSKVITITSNADWNLTFPAWITPSVTSGGSGTTVILLTAGENNVSNRSGEVIANAGGKYARVNVSQPVYIEPYITVTPSAYTFPYSASAAQFIIDSYPGWSAEIISTGETHWGEDNAVVLTLSIPSAVTIDLGQAGCLVNGVVVPGSTYTFPSSGTYSVSYPYVSSTMPVLSGIPYITDIEITDLVDTIPAYAFRGLGLSSITIPDSVTSIGEGAFNSCNTLASFVIPDSVTAIGRSCFSDCVSLSSITIGSGITVLPIGTFNNCRALSGITIPETVTTIGERRSYNSNPVFEGCSALTSITALSQTAATIADNYAFLNIATGGTLHYIAGSDYSTWLSGTSYYLGYYGWVGDESLAPLDLTVTPDTIQNSVYSGSSSIRIVSPSPWSIISTADWVSFSQSAGGSGTTDITVTIAANQYSPQGDAAARQTTATITDGTHTKTLTISQAAGVRIVCDYNVTSTTNSTRLVYSSGSVQNYSLGDGTVVSGGNSYTFSATGIQRVYIYPKNTTTLASNFFSGVTALQSVILPNTYTQINDYAFKGCTGLTSVLLLSGITNIREYCFSGCTSLLSIDLPNTITGSTGLSRYVFADCSSLSSVTLPSGLTAIPTNGFQNCGIQELNIPGSVTRISPVAFSGCTSLTSVTMDWTGPSPRSIEDSAFKGCTSLVSLTMNDVHQIGANAFSGCTSLNDIKVLQGSTPSIVYTTFRGVASGGTLTCPITVNGTYDSWMATGASYLGYYGWTKNDTLPYVSTPSFYASITIQGEVRVKTLSSWTISCDYDWLSFSQMSGSGGDFETITVSCVYETEENRVGYFTLSDGENSVRVYVTQEPSST